MHVRVAIQRGNSTSIEGWGRPPQAAELIRVEIANAEKRLKDLLDEPGPKEASK
jgi:hypothetical protein